MFKKLLLMSILTILVLSNQNQFNMPNLNQQAEIPKEA